MTPSSEAKPVVFVVDDDPSMQAALNGWFQTAGIDAHVYGSTRDFLQASRPEAPGCIVLDVRLPDVSGLDFQSDLARAGVRLPIIFITGYGDVPMSVRAMKAGAIEFLTKPFGAKDLLAAIETGIERDRIRRRNEAAVAEFKGRYAALSPRQREVMAHVVDGRMNKQIAASLGLSEITVKIHRGRIMRKMAARSLADLVRMADRLGDSAVDSRSSNTSV